MRCLGEMGFGWLTVVKNCLGLSAFALRNRWYSALVLSLKASACRLMVGLVLCLRSILRPGGSYWVSCAYITNRNIGSPLRTAKAPTAPIRVSTVMAHHCHQANPLSLA